MRVSNYQAVLNSPLACIAVLVEQNQLCSVRFLDKPLPEQSTDNSYAQTVLEQLQNYFHNPKFEFDLQLRLSGTEFQNRVWQALKQIPSGQTLSYGELAKTLQTSARAVGNACRMNPIPIVLPCHRVIASGGGIGGFSGKTNGREIERKVWLLQHEQSLI